jgi:hypothetical protein
MLAGVVLFAAIWGPSLRVQLHGAMTQVEFLRDESPGHFARTFRRVALLPQLSLNEPPGRTATLALCGAVLYILPLLLYRRRPDLLIWAFLLAGALALPLYQDLRHQWKQLDHLRYASMVMLGVYPLIAAVRDRARRPWMRHVLPGAAVLSCLLSLPRAYAETETPKPDYPHLARTLTRFAKPDDIIVFYHRTDPGYPLLWYMALSWYARDAMPGTGVFLMGPPDERALQVLRRAPAAVWVVADVGESLPGDPLADRARGARTSGFNLPMLQQFVWPTPATAGAGGRVNPSTSHPTEREREMSPRQE